MFPIFYFKTIFLLLLCCRTVFQQSEGVSGCSQFSCHKWHALLACAHSSAVSAWPSPHCCCNNRNRILWKLLLLGGHPETAGCRINSLSNFWGGKWLFFCFVLFFSKFPNILKGADLKETAHADSLCTSQVKPRERCDICVSIMLPDCQIFFFLMYPFPASKI